MATQQDLQSTGLALVTTKRQAAHWKIQVQHGAVQPQAETQQSDTAGEGCRAKATLELKNWKGKFRGSACLHAFILSRRIHMLKMGKLTTLSLPSVNSMYHLYLSLLFLDMMGQCYMITNPFFCCLGWYDSHKQRHILQTSLYAV